MPAKSDLSLVKRIARRLRYRELTDIIGQQVVIHGLSTIEEDVLQQLSISNKDWTLVGPEAKFLQRALGKYSLMDLTFKAPMSLLIETYEGGIPLLRKLHFIPSSSDELSKVADEVFLSENDPSCLNDLDESISAEHTFVKLFMESERIQGTGKHLIGELPDGYFPRTFAVKDACVTNADFVWFHKHFYF
jgi:hypothetical protein